MSASASAWLSASASRATKIVTVPLAGTVPLLGVWSEHVPGVEARRPACTTLVITLNPAPDRICCAAASGSPITDGTWAPPPET